MEFGPAPRISRPALETAHHDPVAQIGRALFRLLIANHLNSDHQPEPAHVADNWDRAASSRNRDHQVRAHARALSISSCFEQFDGHQRRRARTPDCRRK